MMTFRLRQNQNLQKSKAKAQEDGLQVRNLSQPTRCGGRGHERTQTRYFASLDELLTGKRRMARMRITSAFGVFSHQSLGDNPDTVAHLETLANVYGAEPNPDIDSSLLLREYQQFKTWLRNKDPAIASES